MKVSMFQPDFKAGAVAVAKIFITWPSSTYTEYGPILVVQTFRKYRFIFGLLLLVSYDLTSDSTSHIPILYRPLNYTVQSTLF